jgi:hypothetical protein
MNCDPIPCDELTHRPELPLKALQREGAMKPLAEERASAADTRRPGAERIDAVVIGNDDTLLIELGGLLGERYRTHTVDSPADIPAAISVSRWIGIFDAGSMPDARAAIARLETQFPHCPLVVISDRPADWSATVARGTAVGAIAREELAGSRLLEALSRAESRLRADNASLQSDFAPNRVLPVTDSEPGNPGRLRWAVAVLLAAALGGIGWWVIEHYRAPAQAASATGATGPATNDNLVRQPADSSAARATERPQSVLELLSAARIAFRDQKLLLPRPDGEPRGDSALELYTQVISQDPANDEAQDGIRRLFALGKARIQSDLGSGKLDDAGRLVQMFRDAGVAADELAEPSASIASARPKWLQSRVEQSIAAGDLDAADQLLGQLTAFGADPKLLTQLRHELDARRTEAQLNTDATQMRAAIAAGNLLMPPDDARSHFESMRGLARTNSITLAAGHELQTALLARVSAATHAAQFDTAQRYLLAATDLGASSALSDARYALQAAVNAAAHPPSSPALASRPTPVLIAPTSPGPSAAATQQGGAAPAYLAAHPTRALSISYPADQHVAGTVIVEFTLQANGTATDARVVQTDLPNEFGRIAINAVARGRFDTRQLTHAQPQKARLLLRFQPSDAGDP